MLRTHSLERRCIDCGEEIQKVADSDELWEHVKGHNRFCVTDRVHSDEVRPFVQPAATMEVSVKTSNLWMMRVEGTITFGYTELHLLPGWIRGVLGTLVYNWIAEELYLRYGYEHGLDPLEGLIHIDEGKPGSVYVWTIAIPRKYETDVESTSN